jgi:hypothetical protein
MHAGDDFAQLHQALQTAQTEYARRQKPAG